MARFLTMHRSIVPAAERNDFLKRLGDRKAHFERGGCRVWWFEEVGLAGAVIEFIEADNESSLQKALQGAPGSGGDGARIYREMEQKA